MAPKSHSPAALFETLKLGLRLVTDYKDINGVDSILRDMARIYRAWAGRSTDGTSQRETDIARRHPREPSPLVRDSAFGWRTGKINLVLRGVFDTLRPSWAFAIPCQTIN